MNFNGLIFPAPPASYTYENMKNNLFFVPKVGFKNGVSAFYQSNPSSDGIGHIPCLYIENEKGSSKILLYFHGNAEDVGRAADFLNILSHELQVHIIAMEYPGYGIYPGSPNTDRIAEEALNVFDYITNVMQWNPSNIVIFGRSLGGGFATHVAANRKPGMLILMSAFLSIKAVAKHLACIASFLVAERLNNLEIIANVDCPKIFIHGEIDQLVPCDFSIQLHKESKPPKKLVINPEMDHNVFEIYKDFVNPVSEFWEGLEFSGEPVLPSTGKLNIETTELPTEYKRGEDSNQHWTCNI